MKKACGKNADTVCKKKDHSFFPLRDTKKGDVALLPLVQLQRNELAKD
jgi:hypothetical protein